MPELASESLIAHIISSYSLLKPKQLVFAYSQTKSFRKLWANPWIFAPHIITLGQARAIEKISKKSVMVSEAERLKAQGVSLCAYGEPLYPKLLAQIHSPPVVLYYRGNIELRDFPLAVIGSRKVSEYGQEAIKTIVGGFSGLSMTIVSGMALGADAAAHYAALRSGLHTIGVLGSGIDNASIYPRSHITLAKQILDSGGGLISEHPPGTKARPEFFPARNRIIAGMSRAVLVAEAAEKSGTLITARSALEDGRDVWAVPGSIFSALSSSTNQLISNGAYVAQNSEVIIAAYPELSVLKSGSPRDLLQKIIQEEQLLI